MDKIQNTEDTVLICSVQPTVPCLVDKSLDAIANHPQAVINVSYGIQIALICYAILKGVSEVVAKCKD